MAESLSVSEPTTRTSAGLWNSATELGVPSPPGVIVAVAADAVHSLAAGGALPPAGLLPLEGEGPSLGSPPAV